MLCSLRITGSTAVLFSAFAFASGCGDPFRGSDDSSDASPGDPSVVLEAGADPDATLHMMPLDAAAGPDANPHADATTSSPEAGSPDSAVDSSSAEGGGADSAVDSASVDPVPVIGGCAIFPANNPWNTPIDSAPLHAMSATYIANMSPTRALYPDWGDYSTNLGIPWQTVGAGQALVPMTFQLPPESDPGPYPFPLNMRLEAPSDSRGVVLDTSTCKLYEAYGTAQSGAGFTAYSGAKFDMASNTLRSDGWVSTDAAGLPVLPGLVRLSEVQSGAIHHSIRFNISRTQNAFIHPATHSGGIANTALPPMGLRVRLKASFDLSSFSGPALVILKAMKKYGLILADNASDWYVTGDSDDGWTASMTGIRQALAQVHGSDFEAIDTGPLLH
jgi:hypothetical protein